jgi:hypothetical protein
MGSPNNTFLPGNYSPQYGFDPNSNPMKMGQQGQIMYPNQQQEMPPGLIGPTNNELYNSYFFTKMNHEGRQNNFQSKVLVTNALKEGGFSDIVNIVEETGSERSGTPDSIGFLDTDHEGKRKSSLYAFALKKDSDKVNSPRMMKQIAGKYFSGVSTPQSQQSDNEAFGTTPRGSEREFDHGTPEIDGNAPQLTDDMIDNFKLEDVVGKIVEFAKSYNGSR